MKESKINKKPAFFDGKISSKKGVMESEAYPNDFKKNKIDPKRFDELDQKADEFFANYKK